MTSQIYTITPEQASQWIALGSWVGASRPLLAGIYMDKCYCIFGAIPTSLMSDSAYLWLWTPDWLMTEPVTLRGFFFYQAKKEIANLLTRYSSLVCDCYDVDSAIWLLFLGAHKTGPHKYVFRRE